jgi:hypothetical protein
VTGDKEDELVGAREYRILLEEQEARAAEADTKTKQRDLRAARRFTTLIPQPPIQQTLNLQHQ